MTDYRDIQIAYTPSPKQVLFHTCPAEDAVYGGAKGGGKSCALIMEAFAYGMEYPGAEIYLFRETYEQLEANLIKEWIAKIPEQLYTYNQGKYIAKLINGTTVRFRYVARKADAEKYQGVSIDFLGIDELTKHDEATVQELLSCVRSPKGYPPRFRGTCNPGGKGHAWVKRRYVDGTGHGDNTYIDSTSGNRVSFIPAKVYDNPVLMQNDPAYVRRLENLPSAKRKAFLDGDWDSYEGQAFPEWSYDTHVCKPFEIPDHWPRWRCVDNGYTDPFYFGWLTVSEDGQVFLYQEFTRDRDEPKLAYSEQAEKVVAMSKKRVVENGEEVEVAEKYTFTVAGVDAWSTHHRDQTGKSLIDYYADGGLKSGFIRAITDRAMRKATFHEYLKPYWDDNAKTMTAKLQVFSTCKNFIEIMPLLIDDEVDAEKVADDSMIDHPYDGVGYGLIAYHAKQSRPLPEEKSIIATHKEKLARSRSMNRRRLL